MDQPNTKTFEDKIKAARKFDSASAGSGPSVAGLRFHFIGAGGIGMSGLAQLLIRNHGIVTGSDQTPGSEVRALCQMGADIKIGHNADNLSPQTDAVVISAAIKEDNPELKLARQRGCRVYKYARMLGRLMDCYDGIAVSGTHGKSTTSGWLVYCLKQAGLDPNFIVGARIGQLGSSSGTAEGRYFVAEACEYDRSFLNLKPKIACILNIEQDHLDYYKDENEIVAAFADFALGTRTDGVVIANGQDPNVAKVIRQLGAVRRCETFGLDENCNFYAGNIKLINGLYDFDVFHNGKLLGATRISLPGRHNILNALAVTAIGLNAGAVPNQILQTLPNFTGIDRRLMLKGRFIVRDTSCLMRRAKKIRNMESCPRAERRDAILPSSRAKGRNPALEQSEGTKYEIRLSAVASAKAEDTTIVVLDDYAHHPTEIRASLQAIRQRYRPGRIWCVFQPHQYSRTRFLLDDFSESFKLADITIVPEIYFVRDSQAAKKQVNARMLVEKMRDNGTEAVFIDSFEDICDYLKENVAPGDLVVTMGAGDIWKVADGYIQWLRENR